MRSLILHSSFMSEMQELEIALGPVCVRLRTMYVCDVMRWLHVQEARWLTRWELLCGGCSLCASDTSRFRIFIVCAFNAYYWMATLHSKCVHFNFFIQPIAAQLNTKCANRVQVPVLISTRLCWHSHTLPREHSHDIITDLHSYAVFLPFFQRWCDGAEIKPFRRSFISFRTCDMHVREIRQFCHVRNTPLTPSLTKRNTREMTKWYLNWKLTTASKWCGAQVFICSIFALHWKQVRTYLVEFFRQSFERLIHLCRQAKLRPTRGAALLAANLTFDHFWYAFFCGDLFIYCFWTVRCDWTHPLTLECTNSDWGMENKFSYCLKICMTWQMAYSLVRHYIWSLILFRRIHPIQWYRIYYFYINLIYLIGLPSHFCMHYRCELRWSQTNKKIIKNKIQLQRIRPLIMYLWIIWTMRLNEKDFASWKHDSPKRTEDIFVRLVNFNGNEVEEFPLVCEAFDFAFVNTQRQKSWHSQSEWISLGACFVRIYTALNVQERLRERAFDRLFCFRSIRMDHADSACALRTHIWSF